MKMKLITTIKNISEINEDSMDNHKVEKFYTIKK